MLDRGLNNRLRQRSRRAGVMIGVSMVITMALCVAGFSVIFTVLDEFTADFVSEETPDAESTSPSQQPENQPTAAPTEPPETTEAEAETPPPAAEATVDPAEDDDQVAAQETAEADTFVPDYQNSAGQTINLRSGPGTNTEVVIVLTPAQELQFLGESQVSTNPARDGMQADEEWMNFATEDGQEGWVREIDVEPYDPDA
ncbi:MAG: SH3 domain-containing protein [Thermomicrobiales bacterium]